VSSAARGALPPDALRKAGAAPFTALFACLALSCASLEYRADSWDRRPTPPRANDAPIVLVHGLTGFGNNGDALVQYWGGSTDIASALREEGYPVHVAVIDTLASNWDRACELYAFIKGGRVDYGAVHAARHGHRRYGKTYPGVYPEWGEIDPESGRVRSVHLVGHSMGAQTARVLASLLYYGDPDEALAEDASPLFSGGRSWVGSVLSVSGSHDGTSLMYRYLDAPGRIRRYLRLVNTANAVVRVVEWDLGMEHWPGLDTCEGERGVERGNRVLYAPLVWSAKDSGYWEVHPKGAAELNARFKAAPDVYYFSWASSKTSPNLLGRHEPRLGIQFYMWDDAYYMGALTRKDDDIVIDRSWFENDGVVNTRSMDGPKLRSSDTIVPFDGVPRPGIWNYLGVLRNTDHHCTNGILSDRINGIDKLDWYRHEFDRLLALPPPRASLTSE